MIRLRRRAALAACLLLVAATAACGGSASGPATGPPPVTPGQTPGEVLQARAFGPMCHQLPDASKPGGFHDLSGQPVASAAAENTFTWRFTGALRAAGMAEALDQLPDATVFAPYDAAFDELRDELGAQRYAALLADKDGLTELLRHHVVGQRYDRAGLLAAGSVPTLAGGQLTITQDGDQMVITDGSGAVSYVLCGDIRTANANVYLVHNVLMSTGPETVPRAG
ncbi:MAG: fasciclin domain-containing protein [Pseudonocardia sp.]